MTGLDQFDVRLLRILQSEGDLTQAQLAERVHLSPTQCARRVLRLRQDGYIQRFAAVLDHKKLGRTVIAHTLVSLRSHEEEVRSAFRKFVLASAEAVECYSQTGDADYIIKVFCNDLDDFSNFLDRMVKAAGGFAAMRSSIVLKEIKNFTTLPVDF